MKTRLLCFVLLGLTFGLSAGCALARPTATPSPSPTLVQPPGLEVDCWVEPPEPALGSDVTVHMNLLNYDVPINGALTETNWIQNGARQLCITQVQYDLGSCVIDVVGFEPGVYVPVTVSVDYIGWTFLGYTGFTPR